MDNKFGAPTKEESILIIKFRKNITELNVAEYLTTDTQILRWLRARELNLEKAVDMFKKHLVFRKQNDIDNILNWSPPEGLINEYKYDVTGLTTENIPVIFIPFGSCDFRKCVEEYKEDSLKFIWHMYERVFVECKGKTDPETKLEAIQVFSVLDFKGYSFKQLASIETLNTLLEWGREFELNYPEIVKMTIIINAPKIFSILFNLLKPLFSPRTLSKVHIFGPNAEEEWGKLLFENIPLWTVPTEYGGSATKVVTNNKGEKDVPYVYSYPSNFQNKYKSDFLERSNYLKIKPGKNFCKDISIENNNSKICWKFSTDGHDIGFYVLFKDKDLTPFKRYDSANQIIDGLIDCDEMGIYTLVFDNSYSKFKSKTLYYFIEILEDLEEIQLSDETSDIKTEDEKI